jgi:hypothetical protein
LTIVLGAGAALAASALEAHDEPLRLDRLGRVEFEVGCNAEAGQRFNRAMALYHSFAWTEADAAFDAVLAADPTCGMAHWGKAMVLLDNPFVWPGNLPPPVLDRGRATVESARRTGLKDAREHAYVDAVEQMFKDHDKLNHRTRSMRFADALGGVAKAYPADTEASILYGLALSATFDPQDKKYTRQFEATRVLEPIFAKQPDHPGVAHYLIHSYDYPPIASRGLDAASRYSKIAPDAPHALHMPSHIFTRLGYWQQSIEANGASAKAAPPGSANLLHAYDYLAYAHLQLAQERAAGRVSEQVRKVQKPEVNFAAAYALAAVPARYALERGAWKEAAGVELYPPKESWDAWLRFPHAEAVNAYARGIGAARTGDAAAARVQVQRLAALRDATAALKLGYWVEQTEVQMQVVEGLAAWSEGNRAGAIALLRTAAQREDATEKHVVTPGPVVPAREFLAELLLESGDAKGALAEFEATLAREPGRYRVVLGAAQAAERAGDAARAKVHYAELARLGANADAPRPELAHARKVVGSR